MMDKPFSQACENNKRPILDVLHRHFGEVHRVLEIGSGTGQHAVFFAEQLPQLTWQASDLPQNLPGIEAWRAESGLPNLPPPLRFSVDDPIWPAGPFDALFSANTAHIIGWPQVVRLIAGAGRLLQPGGLFLLYGPFNYGGRYTSASNAQFDQWLQQRDPCSGIRDVEAIAVECHRAGFELIDDCAMPANNRTLVWRRTG